MRRIVRDASRVSDRIQSRAGQGPFGLQRGDLNVGNDVRVSALFVARIHRRRSVTVGFTVHDGGVCVERARVEHGVDLRVGTAGGRKD
jgi:hypothetical protein